MEQRFYFEPSIFGGVFDEEFEEASIQLFVFIQTLQKVSYLMLKIL